MCMIEMVKELTITRVCFETVERGIQPRTIYTVTPEEYNMETEGFMGYMVNPSTGMFYPYPCSFSWDGLLYVNKITEEEVIAVIGESRLNEHKKMMESIEVIMHHGQEMARIDFLESPEHECARCGCTLHEPEMVHDKEFDQWICKACHAEEIHENPYAFEVNDERYDPYGD